MPPVKVNKPNTLRRRVSTFTPGKTMTEQAHGNACNINTIVNRYKAGQPLPERDGQPNFGDFSQVVDYHEAVTQVDEAETAFMALPASLRKHFNNDPGQLLQFISDPNNRDEAIRLGLLKRPEPETVPQTLITALDEAVKAPTVPVEDESPKKPPTRGQRRRRLKQRLRASEKALERAKSE